MYDAVLSRTFECLFCLRIQPFIRSEREKNYTSGAKVFSDRAPSTLSSRRVRVVCTERVGLHGARLVPV